MKLQHTAPAGYTSYTSASSHVDVCQIVVPDKAVGAIIGAGGSMIKQIMEDSGAHVNVCELCYIIICLTISTEFKMNLQCTVTSLFLFTGTNFFMQKNLKYWYISTALSYVNSI